MLVPTISLGQTVHDWSPTICLQQLFQVVFRLDLLPVNSEVQLDIQLVVLCV